MNGILGRMSTPLATKKPSGRPPRARQDEIFDMPGAAAASPQGRASAETEAATKVDYIELQKAKARTEIAKADKMELDVRVRSARYVERAIVQAEGAKLLNALSQAIRSIPDGLERQLDLPPEVVDGLAKGLDAALREIGGKLEMLHLGVDEL